MGLDLRGQAERKKQEQQAKVERDKRKVLREKGKAASNTIVELLKAEYNKYV
jgi:hypothetical protein